MGSLTHDLRDGHRVRLSSIGPADRQDLLSGFEGLSMRSRYLRFFCEMPSLPEFVVERLLDTDGIDHVAIAARLVDETDRVLPTIVGVARYFRSDWNTRLAEPAVAVVDALHGLGLGKLLLRRLARIASRQGITGFRAYTLAGNTRIRRMLHGANATFVERKGPVLVYDVGFSSAVPEPAGTRPSEPHCALTY